MRFNFRYLLDCQTRHLIRFNLDSESVWAIIGRQGLGPSWLLPLTGRSAFTCVNLMGENGLKDEFDKRPCLLYATEYTVCETVESECNVTDGPLFTKPGALVHTDKDHYICCGDRYFSLSTGEVSAEQHGAAHGMRAAFAEWGIWLPDEDRGILFFPQT
jgi:hypothetical protein